MKYLMVLACAVLVTSTAFAADHGPVFGYATPVNSEREFSFDTGIFGRYGSQGTQLSTGSGFGYGVTPHITVNAFLPASFGSGDLSESRIMSGTEWSAGASWRFLHSVTSVGKRIESTASLGLVVPGPQQDSGCAWQLCTGHRGLLARLRPVLPLAVSTCGLGQAIRVLQRHRTTGDRTHSPGVLSMVIVRPVFDEGTTSGTIAALQNSLGSTRVRFSRAA